MQNWLRKQNSFTRWTAIGTAASAASAAIIMVAVSTLIIAFIAAFMLGQQTYTNSE